jgi:glycosyltransferase involved in cell wall biosynthesis
MEEYKTEKKRILHIANKNALAGGVGTVIDYLREGVDKSGEFESDALMTTYNQRERRQGKATFSSSGHSETKHFSESELERLLGEYDVVHVHGIPHYGVVEALQKIKKKEDGPKIINTAHSSVKQEFLAQYDATQKSEDKKMQNEAKTLRFYLANNILHDPSKFSDTYWGSAIYRQELIMSLADSVQHMNAAYKDSIIQEYAAEENASKHKVIENGVKVPSLVTDRPRKKRLLYMGRFSKDKGIDEFVDSLPHIFEEHPDAEVRFVGGDESGRMVSEYKAKVEKKLRDHFGGRAGHDIDRMLSRIHFTGWVKKKDELAKHYQWSDYLVVPSTAESFCLVASEALMHGRIPIMTKTKALDDLYVSKGIAFGIDEEKRNGEGIAEAVNKVLDKTESKELDKMAERGRKYAMEHYSFDAMVKKQMNAYNELLEVAKPENGRSRKRVRNHTVV